MTTMGQVPHKQMEAACTLYTNVFKNTENILFYLYFSMNKLEQMDKQGRD